MQHIKIVYLVKATNQSDVKLSCLMKTRKQRAKYVILYRYLLTSSVEKLLRYLCFTDTVLALVCICLTMFNFCHMYSYSFQTVDSVTHENIMVSHSRFVFKTSSMQPALYVLKILVNCLRNCHFDKKRIIKVTNEKKPMSANQSDRYIKKINTWLWLCNCFSGPVTPLHMARWNCFGKEKKQTTNRRCEKVQNLFYKILNSILWKRS